MLIVRCNIYSLQIQYKTFGAIEILMLDPTSEALHLSALCDK